ncbi:MAG: hypothetical protein M1836_005886 [Candelina mexicana]|nr:MAG: hypothetical protein M1836_005886 [Candelina mexicana]
MLITSNPLIALLLLSAAAPILGSPLAQSEAEADVEADAKGNKQWTFKGFAQLGVGDQVACGLPIADDKGRSAQKCKDFGTVAFTRFNFDGNGEWKLCIWGKNDCKDLKEKVNGGEKKCAAVAPGQAITVVKKGKEC